MPKQNVIVFDLEWNIGYQPYQFNYYGVEQVLRGEIISVGAAKIDENANVIDTFTATFRPRIFRRIQHRIAKMTGLTQKDLDGGEAIAHGLRRFIAWCGPDAVFAEWGQDDVPVLKQNLFLLNADESYPTTWYDLQTIFEAQHPRAEGEGMTLESVITRLGLPTERPFHDAMADTLYTVDICRTLDLAKGFAEYPSVQEMMIRSLCAGGGEFHDIKVFEGHVSRNAYRNNPEIRDANCPVCGAILEPDPNWLKRGNNGYYSLCQCSNCTGGEGAAKDGVFLRYKLMRPDGLHWAFARCTELASPEQVKIWVKKHQQALARLEKQKAAEAAAQ